MKAKNEVNTLMNEFASLKTPDQEVEFKQRMDALLVSKSDKERAEFGKAMLEGARTAMEQADETIEICEIKKVLEDIYAPVNWSDIAERYFGKSRYWISQRINGYIVNNKTASFTKKERTKLKNALFDLSERIRNSAQKL